MIVHMHGRRLALVAEAGSIEVERDEHGGVFLVGAEGLVHITAELMPDLLELVEEVRTA